MNNRPWYTNQHWVAFAPWFTIFNWVNWIRWCIFHVGWFNFADTQSFVGGLQDKDTLTGIGGLFDRDTLLHVGWLQTCDALRIDGWFKTFDTLRDTGGLMHDDSIILLGGWIDVLHIPRMDESNVSVRWYSSSEGVFHGTLHALGVSCLWSILSQWVAGADWYTRDRGWHSSYLDTLTHDGCIDVFDTLTMHG